MSTRLSLPGRQSLTATLDEASGRSVVVACPPHPQMSGDRHDGRLQAVSDDLLGRGVDCLRFDYGPWDEGDGEQDDVRQALAWATDRYDRVGLFGFSFGASMALLAAVPEEHSVSPGVVSVVAPAAQVTGKTDVRDAVSAVECPLQVVYGERDETADWKPVVDRARALGHRVDSLPADHFFVGQQQKLATMVGSFLATHLRE